MVKKDSESLISKLIDNIPSLIMETVKGSIKQTIDHIEQALENIHKKIILTFYYYILLSGSIILFSISTILLIDEYFNISKGWSYAIVGFILLFSTIILKNQIKKVKTW